MHCLDWVTGLHLAGAQPNGIESWNYANELRIWDMHALNSILASATIWAGELPKIFKKL
jgi:hypothetical protein